MKAKFTIALLCAVLFALFVFPAQASSDEAMQYSVAKVTGCWADWTDVPTNVPLDKLGINGANWSKFVYHALDYSDILGGEESWMSSDYSDILGGEESWMSIDLGTDACDLTIAEIAD